jgi:hypothetical protein
MYPNRQKLVLHQTVGQMFGHQNGKNQVKGKGKGSVVPLHAMKADWWELRYSLTHS